MVALPTYGPKSPQIVESTAGLVEFLRELVRSTHQPVRDCSRYKEILWIHELPDELTARLVSPEGPLLVLDYEAKAAPPIPPLELGGWLDAEQIDDPAGPDPELAERGVARTDTASTGGTAERRRELVPRFEAGAVLDAYAAWIVEWRTWARRESALRRRRAIYDRLAKIVRRLSQHDDVFEATFAVGLVAWTPERGSRVYRHLVTRRLRIVIDRPTARLEIAFDPNTPARFEDRDFLHGETGYTEERVASLREALTTGSQHPLSPEVVELIEHWRDYALDQPGRYSDAWSEPAEVSSTALVSLTPAIIFRSRDRNALVEYYDRMMSSLNVADPSVPLGLAQLVAPLEQPERLAWSGGSGNRPRMLGKEPLFPLPTNPEQRSILERLQSDTAVVVQGPPGTGKTHTIANLTTALLARGQRVLVTSQKDQALRVLRDKLPTPVRDLCVLLTSQERGGSDDLEDSLTALSDHAASTRLEQLQADIAELEQSRFELRHRQALLEEQIRQLREAEVVSHGEIAPGYSGKPAEIGQKVAAGRARHGWMPLPPEHAPAEPPFGVGQFAELRDLLRAASRERYARWGQWLPDLATLPTPEAFADLVAGIQASTSSLPPDADPTHDALANLDASTLDQIDHLLSGAADALHQLGVAQHAAQWEPSDWRTRALTDCLANRSASLWAHVAASADRARDCQNAIATLALADIQIPPMQPYESAAFLQAATA